MTVCVINVLRKLRTEDERIYGSFYKHNALPNSCFCGKVYNGMEMLVVFSVLWVGVELRPE